MKTEELRQSIDFFRDLGYKIVEYSTDDTIEKNKREVAVTTFSVVKVKDKTKED
jgi:hypothetical protein